MDTKEAKVPPITLLSPQGVLSMVLVGQRTAKSWRIFTKEMSLEKKVEVMEDYVAKLSTKIADIETQLGKVETFLQGQPKTSKEFKGAKEIELKLRSLKFVNESSRETLITNLALFSDEKLNETCKGRPAEKTDEGDRERRCKEDSRCDYELPKGLSRLLRHLPGIRRLAPKGKCYSKRYFQDQVLRAEVEKQSTLNLLLLRSHLLDKKKKQQTLNDKESAQLKAAEQILSPMFEAVESFQEIINRTAFLAAQQRVLDREIDKCKPGENNCLKEELKSLEEKKISLQQAQYHDVSKVRALWKKVTEKIEKTQLTPWVLLVAFALSIIGTFLFHAGFFGAAGNLLVQTSSSAGSALYEVAMQIPVKETTASILGFVGTHLSSLFLTLKDFTVSMFMTILCGLSSLPSIGVGSIGWLLTYLAPFLTAIVGTTWQGIGSTAVLLYSKWGTAKTIAKYTSKAAKKVSEILRNNPLVAAGFGTSVSLAGTAGKWFCDYYQAQ